jgi:hypothetical protein
VHRLPPAAVDLRALGARRGRVAVVVGHPRGARGAHAGATARAEKHREGPLYIAPVKPVQKSPQKDDAQWRMLRPLKAPGGPRPCRVRPARARQAAVDPPSQAEGVPAGRAELAGIGRLRRSGGAISRGGCAAQAAREADLTGVHLYRGSGRGTPGLQAAPRPSGSACGPRRTGPPRRRCTPRPRRRRSSPCLASARSSLQRAESISANGFIYSQSAAYGSARATGVTRSLL